MTRWTQLAAHVFVHHGAINVGIIRVDHRALLIDYGAGDVETTLCELGIERIERVLFTHHHRDQASGLALTSAVGARIGVPAAEIAWFSQVERYWEDPAQRWHLYDFRPHNLMLARSIPVHDVYSDGDMFSWGPTTISVLETPGHTDGSVSYLITLREAHRDVRFLFCGDAIYGEGQVWDCYSLQKGWQTRDYHGYMGDRKRLDESLDRLCASHADALIPSHGQIMTCPTRAIALLRERLVKCYEQYVAISALRYYYPALFTDYASQVSALPIGDGLPCPDFLHHLGTTWVVSSADTAAFAIDCGSEQVISSIQEMRSTGEVGCVEWLWISHYHDDHVDAIPQFVETFHCPVVTDEHVAQIVEQPLSWRLPCISPVTVSVDRKTTHGESWRWHEYTVTAYHLPGQTLYHGGLLVEGRGARILFAGDSFTMAGIDDYCMGNRNYLGQGVGFDACLALVEQTQPDYVLNCHVDVAFRFSRQSCQLMRRNLAERERLYGDLLPWDHPNYGLDEHWIRCHPYEQRAVRGRRSRLCVVVTNHSDMDHKVLCRPVLPKHWNLYLEAQRATIPRKTEGCIVFDLAVPSHAEPGRWIIPVDVAYQGRQLGEIREAVLVVQNDGRL